MSAAVTLTAPRRPVDTYTHNGRETYADTGRPVDERLGTHVVLWIVDDPEVWAAAIEAAADAELANARKADRSLAEYRRHEDYESAARIRAEGPNTTVRAHYHDAALAEASVADLYRAHPNPGVRYEVAEITDVGACPDCHQPRIFADGQWWHHTGRYPAECAMPPEHNDDEAPERQPGEWEINVGGMGYIVCGYCDDTVSWPWTILGYAMLTGVHMLGIELATGELVVLAEAITLSGATVPLPHHCRNIPAEVYERYADEVREAKARREPGSGQ